MKPFYKVTMNFKSGNSVKFKCQNITIKNPGNELTGYEATGIVGSDLPIFYIRIEEIESISTKITYWPF